MFNCPSYLTNNASILNKYFTYIITKMKNESPDLLKKTITLKNSQIQ